MSLPESQLECGTSLAEHEYQTLTAPAQDFFSSSSDSLDTFRDSISVDVVTNGNGLSTFISPISNKPVPLVYCDQTASNRPLESIEKYIESECLPLYGNTHTTTSIAGSQSTAFVAEARQIVAEETNAKITGKANQDLVLFA